MGKSPTIWDVASLAGVSKSTVSMFINKNGYVGNNTAEKIAKAVSELGYVPNHAARAMRTNKTGNLAVIVPDYANPFFIELFSAVESAAQRRGYSVQMMATNYDNSEELNRLRDLRHRVDGLINCTYDRRQATMKNFAELSKSVSMIFMDPWPKMPNGFAFSQVIVDGQAGSAQAVDYLVKTGHRRIAYLRGQKKSQATHERFLGYLSGLKRNNLEYDPAICRDCSFVELLRSGYDAVIDLIASGVDFDAIMAVNDMMAIGAIKALKKLGRQIPEDVAVVGFDNIGLCELVEPNLSTVSQPIQELGNTGLNLLADLIEKKQDSAREITLAATFIERRSTNPDIPDQNDFSLRKRK